MKATIVLLLSCVLLSAAYGLRCHVCLLGTDCSLTMTCTEPNSQCFKSQGILIEGKGCMREELCKDSPVHCCDTDLCNAGTRNEWHVGQSLLLLLVSLASIALFH
ncbi:hypothetical protein MATL_G00087880 [Megalops atlanticus]|uniref:Uncharacterized protein n=1 Tax=Megalops atlanticus TaxID=7932 RepID=A0A9D3T8B1_MEGAT|nr:hypothetical protein MATL_G00087880 [Megalops atlanticus]